MSTERQNRRGTKTQHNTFTGAVGEVTVDTTNKRQVIHDALKAGGFPCPNIDDLQSGRTVYAQAGGTANALTLALAPPIIALVEGLRVGFEATATNTASATLNVDGKGVKTCKKNAGGDNLAAGDFVIGGHYMAEYDGANWQIIAGQSGGGGGVWTFVATHTGSGSTVNIETTALFDGTYDEVLIFVERLEPDSQGNGHRPRCRIKSGGSYKTASYQSYLIAGEGGMTAFATDNAALPGAISIGATINSLDRCSGYIRIRMPADTTERKFIHISFISANLSPHRSVDGWGYWDGGDGALQGIHFFMVSAGTIQAFTAHSFGKKNA